MSLSTPLPAPRPHIWIVILACSILCSCSPGIIAQEPPLDTSAQLSDTRFITRDGSELPVKKWLPVGAVEGVLIAVHGFNDYSNFIKDGAPYFNEHRLAVYAYDQRGFGETKTRGRWTSRKALTDDLATFIRLIQAAYPDTPLYVLGDSMGGAVTIATMVINKPERVNGIILVAPAVWARTEMPLYQRFALWLSAHTVPWMKVSGKSLDIVASDNIEMLRDLGRDPLVIKESRIEALYGLSNLMDEAYSLAEELHCKTLLLYGQKDEIIPRTPVSTFYERLPGRADGRQQLILYENGYHMLLRDSQADVVLHDIVDWITNQASTVTDTSQPAGSITRN